VLSALAYLSQTADRPVVDLRGEGMAPTRRINFHFFAMLIFLFNPEFCLGRKCFFEKKFLVKNKIIGPPPSQILGSAPEIDLAYQLMEGLLDCRAVLSFIAHA
jgi:hypothetical protein